MEQQSKKPKEQVEDKVALIVEEIRKKIDLKMDGETMKMMTKTATKFI